MKQNENSKNFDDWILKAENELKAARAIFQYYEDPPTDMVCYHCHQTAEKSLKGFLVYSKIAFPKIHDLITLLNFCLREDKTLEFLREKLKVLNQYYIEARYPPDMPLMYSKEEAKEAITNAEQIFTTIKSKLKK